MKEDEIAGIVKYYEAVELTKSFYDKFDCNPQWTVVSRGEQIYIHVEHDIPEVACDEPEVNVYELHRDSESWVVGGYEDAWDVCEMIEDYLIERDKNLYR
jgi:hypothetical protein